MTDYAAPVAQVKDRIASAALRAGREPHEITLVAVSKRQSSAAIEAVSHLGIKDFGESYLQESLEKRAELPSVLAGSLNWHLIGHLQRNKIKAAVGSFSLIQSVDSIPLAQAIARHALLTGYLQPILLQVHLGNEETKFGFAPEKTLEAVKQMQEMQGLELKGLMGIAPFGEEARPYFASLARLFEQMPAACRKVLSMGMTGDFETAIEEGATLVRIGTALFGPRAR